MTVELERQKDREHEELAIKTFCAKYGRFWEKIGGMWQPDFLVYKEDKKLYPEAKPTAIVEVKGIRDTKGSEHPYPSFIVANRKLMTVDAYIKANPAIEQAFDDRAMSLIIIWAFSDVLCWAEWMKLEGSLNGKRKENPASRVKTTRSSCLVMTSASTIATSLIIGYQCFRQIRK